MRNYEMLFPFWSKLSDAEKELIEQTTYIETYNKGMLMHRTEDSCKGLMTVLTGQLRTYILSEEGREVTLFRVNAEEVCVLSASCLLDAITFDVLIEATEDTEVLVVPSAVLNQVMQQNPYVELFLYKAATEKFSDVMWTMQQILFLKIDQRVAQFLWDEMIQKNSMTLSITHDEIARYIGSAREVVTKVLKYMVKENVLELKRGTIIILDKEKLRGYM
ncbi:MAG: Crp/Fnr family transcriptional regulator [Agathobacter sp.]|nr:Crp/Fnr family transcriptional regulator [Agathobacter sp.]